MKSKYVQNWNRTTEIKLAVGAASRIIAEAHPYKNDGFQMEKLGTSPNK